MKTRMTRATAVLVCLGTIGLAIVLLATGGCNESTQTDELDHLRRMAQANHERAESCDAVFRTMMRELTACKEDIKAMHEGERRP